MRRCRSAAASVVRITSFNMMWFVLVLVCTVSVLRAQEENFGNGNGLPSASPHTDRTGRLTRCYDRLGCFPVSGDPYSTGGGAGANLGLYPGQYPQTPPISFMLYTRRNLHHPQRLSTSENSTFSDSHFDASRPVKIIIPGYLENGLVKWVREMATELLTQDNYNVIVVDWAAASAPPYAQATANARAVGDVLGDFIRHLQDRYEMSPGDIHLIGNGVGAHIAGHAGQRVDGLGRITGLDPAEAYYQDADQNSRLDLSDANFVDVIHTESPNLQQFAGDPSLHTPQSNETAIDYSKAYGSRPGRLQENGHVDFYPNGGGVLGGCGDASGRQNYPYYAAAGGYASCANPKAYELFTESINTDCPFLGYACESYENFTQAHCTDGCGPDGSMCAPLGFRASEFQRSARSEPTRMFLQTSRVRPYCRYHYRVTAVVSDNDDARRVGAQRGHMAFHLSGTRGPSHIIEGTREPVEFTAGNPAHFLISTPGLGQLLRMEAQFRPSGGAGGYFQNAPWRGPYDVPRVYISQFNLVGLETGDSATFCGKDDALHARRVRTYFQGSDCLTSEEGP